MSEPLEFGERVYRSFPAPLINFLLHRKGVGQPTAIVESVEASTGIPGFNDKEFAQLMRKMERLSREGTEELETLVAKRGKRKRR